MLISEHAAPPDGFTPGVVVVSIDYRAGTLRAAHSEPAQVAPRPAVVTIRMSGQSQPFQRQGMHRAPVPSGLLN